jgi:hypothetical protein
LLLLQQQQAEAYRPLQQQQQGPMLLLLLLPLPLLHSCRLCRTLPHPLLLHGRARTPGDGAALCCVGIEAPRWLLLPAQLPVRMPHPMQQ